MFIFKSQIEEQIYFRIREPDPIKKLGKNLICLKNNSKIEFEHIY